MKQIIGHGIGLKLKLRYRFSLMTTGLLHFVRNDRQKQRHWIPGQARNDRSGEEVKIKAEYLES